MCTAISMYGANHYFGRNLDLPYHYDESIVISPRQYPMQFRKCDTLNNHYAMIGVAMVVDNYPLYYDAVNEHGLGICALNFPGNAKYFDPDPDRVNISSFELIPWILGQYREVAQVINVLDTLNITNAQFNNQYPPTPLHWLVSDSQRSIVIEQTADRLCWYDNPIHVLTNNPPFPYHMENIRNYLNVTAKEPTNRFSQALTLSTYSIGMGGMGLPGDLSSASRFVRAAFQLHNSVCQSNETAQVNQFFHILRSVEQTEGCAEVGGDYEKTIYSSCCNTIKGIYYYTTYQNSQISCVDMRRENLDGQDLITYPLHVECDFNLINKHSRWNG